MGQLKTKQTGDWGESEAVQFLVAAGYQVLERNWRSGRSEIDIIAVADKTLVFVEVKVRKSSAYGFPETFVMPSQVNRIKNAAEQYQFKINYSGFIRFDIISVLGIPGRFEIEHFKDAL